MILGQLKIGERQATFEDLFFLYPIIRQNMSDEPCSQKDPLNCQFEGYRPKQRSDEDDNGGQDGHELHHLTPPQCLRVRLDTDY